MTFFFFLTSCSIQPISKQWFTSLWFSFLLDFVSSHPGCLENSEFKFLPPSSAWLRLQLFLWLLWIMLGIGKCIKEKMVVSVRFTSMYFSFHPEFNPSSPGFPGCSQKPLNRCLVFCILFIFYDCPSQKFWFHICYYIVDTSGRSLFFLTH